MEVRILGSSDADAFQALRLCALQTSPTAFSSSFEEESGYEGEQVVRMLISGPYRAVFGAFVEGRIVGITGVYRDEAPKLVHKAVIWGVFVHPEFRGGGCGRLLMQTAMAHALSMPGVHHLLLSVNAKNVVAKALYESVGFESYALERAYMIVDGVLQDELHMVYWRPA